MKQLCFALVLLAVATVTIAQEPIISDVSINFVAFPDMSVFQNITFSFSNPFFDNQLEYVLLYPPRDVVVMADGRSIPFGVKEDKIIIFLNQSITRLFMSFFADDVIFQNNDVNHFFSEVEISDAGKVNAKFFLPVGYTLHDTPSPAPTLLSSDGRRIIVAWELSPGPGYFSVKYSSSRSFNAWLVIAMCLLVIVVLLLYFYFVKVKKALLHGFSEDEQRTIIYVKHHKIVYQKQLQQELGFSKAKATRVIKKLEEKGLIRKEELGRANKIHSL